MDVRVLLVEDDDRILEMLSMALRDEGCDVVAAHTGEEALELVGSVPIDLVLLDLMLPGIDGFEVCAELRSRSEVPIIMVTARSDASDVIRGLEAGADDYVTKPLMASVLAARIRALLRRTASGDTTSTDRVLRVGGIELRPDEGTASREGRLIHLTRTEFQLFTELASDPGKVITREELLQRVWGYDYFGDTRLLDVHIRRLRRKVEADPNDPTLILTVRGSGYKTCRPDDPDQ